MDFSLSTEWILFVVILIALLVIIITIAWSVRSSKTTTKKMELEIEREKLEILKRDMAAKLHPFTKISAEQLAALKTLEIENETLEVDNYAKEKMVESRLRKLENLVKGAKLDQMLRRIDGEEKKVK
ncbi:MAG: hypothetical protein PHF57_13145 [Methanoregula sp.]|nr:hypothetical protein [Methanoregula sp.]MDD5025393.1 hypothetical protein [Methanoregula sp.]MDD5189145.1 hypothetical protein [Methanoregula sp.]